MCEKINKLIIEYADLNLCDFVQTPDMLKELVGLNADISTGEHKLLRKACTTGDTDLVRFLLDKHADPTAARDYAITIASEYGFLDIVGLLLKGKADINAHADYSLKWSAYHGHHDLVRFLLQSSANVSDSTIAFAEYNSNPDIAETICRAKK
jgi:ankyrin repeat protein